jgi:flagellar hook-basal body complex protein FliE
MAIGPVDPGALSLAQPHEKFDGVSSVDRARPFDGSSPLAEKGETSGFSSLFADAVGRANASDAVAHTAALDLAAGRTDDIHGTMIATQKANIEMRLVGNVRNKVVDAFYELWRMSV